jgi:hypothetical protein
MAAGVLEVALSHCAVEDFDGEIVALNLDTGMYFSIRDTGAILWHDLAAGHSVETLMTVAVGNPEFAQSIERLADELVEAGLMRPAESVSAPGAPPALAAVTIAQASPPVLEAFGDMQKLLLLDPVHEVDEVGWPAQPRDDNAQL